MAYILIVDDDEDFATATAAVLRSAGHEVDLELDANEALSRMERRRPDLVVLDVMFPEDLSAGFRVARALRLHNEEFADMPEGFDTQFFIMMLVPFVGVASAFVGGVLAHVAARVMKRTREMGT